MPSWRSVALMKRVKKNSFVCWAFMSGECYECGEHTLQCRCVDGQSLPIIVGIDSIPMDQGFWATAYDKFERWKRAQWLFYLMTARGRR